MEKLVLTEEEQMVRDSASGFLSEHAGPAVLRKIRDTNNEFGFVDETWQAMVQLGWPSILIPEKFGGVELSHVAMGQIMELCGAHLACSPLFSSAVAGASVILTGGSDQQKEVLLPEVASGHLTLALAIDEASRHDPTKIRTEVTRRDTSFRLNGNKCFVADGGFASQLIVSAITSYTGEHGARMSLFLVPREMEGVTVVSTPMVDSRNSAMVSFDNVLLPSESLIGGWNQGLITLQAALNITNIHLSAELLGIANEAFQRTLQYLKSRKQFGSNIGSFQALQHRAAKLWTEIELCKSVVMKALRTLDETPADIGAIASVAKAKTCQVAELATNEAIQMHGGIGMTDEFDIGLFIKRARVVQILYGDRRYHLDKCAQLRGY